jgi:hypothetical protein
MFRSLCTTFSSHFCDIYEEVGCWDKDWIELAQGRDRWWALVNAVMNFRVSLNAGISCLAKNRLASQGLCSMESVSYK